MADRPNILLLFTDQHRLSAVGCYGDTPCKTPTIDRLAKEGVRFENAYTVCPVCSPARGTIMTGLYPHAHGICMNIHNMGNSIHEIHDSPRLLSRRLEASGYGLGYTGKWHLGSDQTETFGVPNTPMLPKDVGFEGQNFPGHGGGGFHYPEYKAYLEANGWEHRVKSAEESGLRHAGELAGPLESTVPYFLASHTLDLMDEFQKRDAPFFLWHNNWGPHGPYFSTSEYIDMYRDVEIPPWPNFDWPARSIPGAHWNKLHPRSDTMSWNDWVDAVRCYYAFATMIDAQFERMLAHMESTGLLDNTIVIMTADHGETCGSHGGLTDKGYHHFEETHRIPMIARFPDQAHAGTVIEDFASLADIYPTVLEMAGATPDESELHGRSLLPLIEGQAESWREHVVTEFNGVNSIPLAQRTLRWKHLKYGANVCGPDEIYDLARDPHETRNLIDHPEYRGTGRELRKRLLAWMKETNDPVAWIYERNKVGYYDGAAN